MLTLDLFHSPATIDLPVNFSVESSLGQSGLLVDCCQRLVVEPKALTQLLEISDFFLGVDFDSHHAESVNLWSQLGWYASCETGDVERRRQFLLEEVCLLYTSPSPRDKRQSRMPSSA